MWKNVFRVQRRGVWNLRFCQTTISVVVLWIVFAMRNMTTKRVGRWSGFLQNLMIASVVIRNCGKSSFRVVDMTSTNWSLRWPLGLSRMGRQIDLFGGDFGHQRVRRFVVRVDGSEGNFWVVDPGVPSNGCQRCWKRHRLAGVVNGIGGGCEVERRLELQSNHLGGCRAV
jgi:hypothetical protein